MASQLQINRVACASMAAEQNSAFNAHFSPSKSGLPISLHIKQIIKNINTTKFICMDLSKLRKLPRQTLVIYESVFLK